MACSPTQRIFVWVVLWRRLHSLSRRPRNGTWTGCPAPWYALSAQHLSRSAATASMIPWRPAAVRSWAEPGRAGEAHSRRPNGSVRPWTFMPWRLYFPAVRGVGGDPVDRQEGAVQDHECLLPGRVGALGQAGSAGGTGSRRPRGCSGRPWRRQYRTRRRAGRSCHRTADEPGRAGPVGRLPGVATTCRSRVIARPVARSGSAGCGWTGRSPTGGQAREAPGSTVDLGRDTVLPGASSFRWTCPTRAQRSQVGKESLRARIRRTPPRQPFTGKRKPRGACG